MTVHSASDPALNDGSRTWAETLRIRLDPGWRPGEWDATSGTFVANLSNPDTWVFVCKIPGCGGLIGHRSEWCVRCRKHYSLLGRPSDFADTFRPPPAPVDDARYGQFCLGELAEPCRVEITFALQIYTQTHVLSPFSVRNMLRFIPADLVSLLDLDDTRFPGKSVGMGLFRSLRAILRKDRVQFDGTDLTAGDVWDCELLGLNAKTGRRSYPAVGSVLDFRPVRQSWLRELLKEFLRSTHLDVATSKRTLTATMIASHALDTRSHGDDPTELGYADMTAVVEGFQQSLNQDGKTASPTRRAQLYIRFKIMINFCRRSGLMEDVPSSFAFPDKTRLQLLHRYSDEEDLAGRALPETVIDQLDRHLHHLGAGSSFAPPGWLVSDQERMFRVIYQVLRDTGRRPAEATTLKQGCVIRGADGKPILIYDNHKSRRLGRRLPVSEATAASIEAWETRLVEITPEAENPDRWLFPSPGSRGRLMRSGRHLTTDTFINKLRRWVDGIPAITYDGVDTNGMSVAYPRDKITAYALRHSYAQRHADAGTPVDVLRELMDHLHVDTTMGYYKVSMKRRRAAVAAVSELIVDRNGRRRPAPDRIDYEVGTVAVPFGNCAEPTNVKAGGGQCPIRFQCAGCAFYRPDPSYLPAIEAHVAELRVNKEQAFATDAAGWVVTNLQDQLDAFATVQLSLADLVASLTDDERGRIEAAGRELRRARQHDAAQPADRAPVVERHPQPH